MISYAFQDFGEITINTNLMMNTDTEDRVSMGLSL